MAVHVAGEQAAAIFIRPVVTEIDHRAGVGVTSARLVVLHPKSRTLPISTFPMSVIGTGVDQFVQVRIEVGTGHALVVRAMHQVPQMADHTIRKEAMAQLIEVQTPRIGRAVADDLESAIRVGW